MKTKYKSENREFSCEMSIPDKVVQRLFEGGSRNMTIGNTGLVIYFAETGHIALAFALAIVLLFLSLNT